MLDLENDLWGGGTVPVEVLKSASILIVDDVLPLRELIKTYLENEGFAHLELAENGQQALEMLERHSPDLIVLDILMPDVDGIEFLHRVRADKRWHDIPILVQTGIEETDKRLEVFKVGASDLISKPINGPELIARVKIHLQNLFMQRKQKRFAQRMAAELQAAQRIQKSLLPPEKVCKQVFEATGARVKGYYKASSELGGDFWGVKTLGPTQVGVFIIDFAGHGVVSALNTFRLHTLLNETELDWHTPELWIMAINTHLSRLTPPDQFAVVFYAIADLKKDEVRYVASGCPEVVIADGQGNATVCDTSGLPIGIREAAAYKVRSQPFPPGSSMFLYSDALIETPGADGRMLDLDTLSDAIASAARANDAQALIDAAIEVFPGDAEGAEPLEDDLTLVALCRDAEEIS